jgi:hypothetical protein
VTHLDLNLNWAAAAHSLKAGLVILDLNGVVLTYNKGWSHLSAEHDIPEDFDWHGVNLIQIGECRRADGDALAAHCLSKLDHLVQSNGIFEPVQFYTHTSSGIRWLMLEVALLHGPANQPEGIILSLHDLTFLRTTASISTRLHSPVNRLLPICAVCKKIRDAEDQWHDMESYFKTHLHIEFTHDICTDCIGHLYPKYAALLDKNRTE